ncbi:MAG TPA: hypothetical protein PK358_12550 [Spirochaetota bacterium]|nr:hypothetical protein [Spirochaetota bacterium]
MIIKKSMKLMNCPMKTIAKSSGDMTNIIDMITGIADQINLHLYFSLGDNNIS